MTKRALPKGKKVDIFDFFKKAANNDFGYVDGLTDEEVKTMSPYMLLMWEEKGTFDGKVRNFKMNEYINGVVFDLAHHPRLLLKLFVAIASDNKRPQWEFIKSVGQREVNVYKSIAKYYDVGYEEAKEIHKLLSKEDIAMIEEIYEND